MSNLHGWMTADEYEERHGESRADFDRAPEACECSRGSFYEQSNVCDLHAECVRCKAHGIGIGKGGDGSCFSCLAEDKHAEAE